MKLKIVQSRRAFALASAAAWLASARRAWSAYPEAPITVVVPYPAGGTTDRLGRLVAEQLRLGLGATVAVENRPGAGTSVGAAHVAHSAADGHVLLLATSTTLAINKWLYKALPYDPVADFTPIALVAAVPFALIVGPKLPIDSLKDFVAYSRAHPGELVYGSAGVGSPHHLGAEMLARLVGATYVHAPYRGSVPAMQDVLNGQLPFMIVDLQPALPLINAGKLKALCVTTAERVKAAPNIPTAVEAGLSGFELTAWQGLVAPAHTPRAFVETLALQVSKLLASPETTGKLIVEALEPIIGSGPDDFAVFLAKELERWRMIVIASGARAD